MSRPNIAFSVRASSGTISGWMGSAMMTGWWLVLLGGGDFWAESSIFSEVKWLSESKLVPHVFFCSSEIFRVLASNHVGLSFDPYSSDNKFKRSARARYH